MLRYANLIIILLFLWNLFCYCFVDFFYMINKNYLNDFYMYKIFCYKVSPLRFFFMKISTCFIVTDKRISMEQVLIFKYDFNHLQNTLLFLEIFEFSLVLNLFDYWRKVPPSIQYYSFYIQSMEPNKSHSFVCLL
jgi:hypothetical protein